MTNAIAERQTPAPPVAEIASPVHLAVVLALLSLWALRGAINPDRMAAVLKTSRMTMYLTTMIFEWAMLAFVLAGLRARGTSPYAVLGERWRSANQLMRDVGIAALFWLLSTILLSALFQRHDQSPSPVVQAMLPHGLAESLAWLALSITAGICEEAIYRGYLQRQLIAFTRSVPIGIVLTAAAFGLAHSYKGGAGALQVGVGALMFGLLAYWVKSVRPGMMAHAFTDAFAGIVAALLKIKIA